MEKFAHWRGQVSEAIGKFNGTSLGEAGLAGSYEIVSLGEAPSGGMVLASKFIGEEAMKKYKAKKSQDTHLAFGHIREVLDNDPQWVIIKEAATTEGFDPWHVAQLKQEYFQENFIALQRRSKVIIEEGHQQSLKELSEGFDKAVSQIYLRQDEISRTMKERLAPIEALLNDLYARHRDLSAPYETYRPTVEQEHEDMIEEGILSLLGL